MERLWFITNPQSGSSGDARAEAIEGMFAEHGLHIVGRTLFPDEPLPDPRQLDKVKVDVVALFAGDGTINAAASALADWKGAILILPGGTMNLLARALHGTAEPAAIIAAAHRGGRRVALPYVEAGPHRALVGMIVGPAANWFRAREEVRARRFGGLFPAMRKAWRRTFGRGIRLSGVTGLGGRLQAVYIHAADAHLEVAAVDARDFHSIADLGWNWITGDWLAARAVTEHRADTVHVAERRPVLALFDGEPVSLEPGTPIRVGRSLEQFIATSDGAK